MENTTNEKMVATATAPELINKKLKGKKVAILITDGFEESEFAKPYERLKVEKADVTVISLTSGEVKAWSNKNWGHAYQTDKTIEQVKSEDFDALVLPGGVINADKLRMSDAAIVFVSGFFKEGKPIAAICHAPWILIECRELEGRTVTSYSSLKTDLKNAGAIWVDEEVVNDKGLITSRNPNDLPAFCNKMVEEFAEGIH